ncbi:MAG TPA: MFS transporter [Novosphingobium sp.]|nr:MFS transporter [Novosphingobium sp.]
MQTQERSPARPTRGSGTQAWYAVFVLLCASILSYLDRGIINVLVTDLRRSLHLSEVQISLIQGLSFSVFFVVACIPVGSLVDRFSRRNIIIVGVFGWSVMTAACGLADNFWQLFLARAGVGIGEACLIPAAYSMISDLFPSSKRGRPMSVLLIGMAVGAAASSMIGGAVLKLMGDQLTLSVPLLGETEVWRLAFFTVAMPGALCVLLLASIREPERVTTRRPHDQEGGFTRFLGGHWRTFLPLYLGIACISVLSYATANWAPTALVRVLGYSRGDAGVMIGAIMVPASIIGAGLGGLIGDRLIAGGKAYGRLRAWLGGTLPIVLGCLMLILGGSPWVFLAGYFIIVATSSAFGAMSYPALYDSLPGQFHGRAAGVGTLSGNLFGMAGGTTMVAVLTEHVFRNDSMVHYSMAIVAAAAAILSTSLVAIQLRGYERLRKTLASSAQH